MSFLSSVLAGATLLQVGAKPEVTVAPETYKGWAGSYRLSNGRVDVVVVPQIGRIMFVGLKGGKNLLWENPSLVGIAGNLGSGEYQNFGGDKVWIAPQSLWTWPPDQSADGAPWEAKPTEDGLVMTSPVSKKWGVQFEREITLARGTALTIKNTVTNSTDKPIELSVWQITQVDDPSMTALKTKSSATMPNGWHGYEKEALDSTYHRYDNMSSTLYLQRNPAENRKFGGAMEDGYVETTFGTGNDLTSFRMSAPYNSSETYPDNGSAMQVYLNRDPDKYVEMEVASPIKKLRPGQKLTLPVRWQLKKSEGVILH